MPQRGVDYMLAPSSQEKRERRKQMKRTRYVLLCFGVIFICSFLGVAQEITIEPQNLVITLASGESASGEIIITNNSDKKIEIDVFRQNWLNERGNENVWGLARWTIIEPSSFTIPAGSQKGIRYSVNIPNDAGGPHWVGLHFAKVSRTTDGETVFKTVALASIKQIDPNNLVHGALLINFGFAEREGERFIWIQVQKMGTDFNSYNGEIEIREIIPRGGYGIIGIFPVRKFEILPLHSDRILVPYNVEFFPGVDYQAIVKIHLDNELTIIAIWTFRILA